MTELGTVPPQGAPSGPDEQALLRRLRGGEDAAFGELFELHAAAVRRLAQSLASDRSEAEDITAETFFRVLQALRRGSGPRDYIRAYLLTVARRVSWEWHGARRDVPVSDDELTFRAGAGADTHARTAEHTLITTAFTSLPERWRTVLWQTEVEGEQPAIVATHFGLSANATAALARRARQGLRAAYLQAHLSVNCGPDSCRAVVEKLGGFTAGSVTGAEAERIRAHLHGCTSCRATQDELRDVCSSLRAHAGVIALLVPAAGSVGGGLLSGLGTTLKSLLMGSKIKVGLALASTAAAGAVGIAAGPMLLSPDHGQDVGLTGGAELALVPPRPHLPPQVQQPQIGIARLDGRRSEYDQPSISSPHLGVGDVPSVPGAGGVPGLDPQVPGGQQGAGTPTLPRDDLPSSNPGNAPMTSKTSSRMDPPSQTESAGPVESSDPVQPSPELTTTPTSTSSPVTTTGTMPTSSAASDGTATSGDSTASDTTDPSDSVRPTRYAPPPEDYGCPYTTP